MMFGPEIRGMILFVSIRHSFKYALFSLLANIFIYWLCEYNKKEKKITLEPTILAAQAIIIHLI